MRLFGVIALATLIGGAAQASTVNLVTNGSFEDNPLGSGNWSHFSNVPGWTGDPNVEIQSNRTLGSIDAKDGSYYAELDTNQDAGMFQDIFLNAGSYDFSFFYSPRVNDTNTATNDMFYSFKDMATQTLTLLSGTISGAPNASYPHGVDRGQRNLARSDSSHLPPDFRGARRFVLRRVRQLRRFDRRCLLDRAGWAHRQSVPGSAASGLRPAPDGNGWACRHAAARLSNRHRFTRSMRPSGSGGRCLLSYGQAKRVYAPDDVLAERGMHRAVPGNARHL